MIVVTTPTGQIGARLVQDLLAAGERVRVIARSPDRIAPEIRPRLEIVPGSSDEESVLMRALDGAEALFLLIPPSLSAPDTTQYYLQFARPACRAIAAQGVKRVVSVSGIGRGLRLKAGPISAAFAKDDEIEKTGVDFRALWCPGFMENMLRQLDSLRHRGAFFLPSRPDVKAPHVATRDIAASAARLLCDRSWRGQGGLAVLGPEDLSLDDMAAIMTDVLATPIRFQQISAEAYKAQLTTLGVAASVAQGMLDMFAAADDGLNSLEPRNAANTGPTRFRQWCEEILKPAFSRDGE